MHKWYVAQVISSQEKRVKQTLEENRDGHGMKELIHSVILPTEKVSEVKQGQRKVVEKRIWPGYLLLKMILTDESWLYVKNTSGVLGFLGGENPTELAQEEVSQILKEVEDRKLKVTEKHTFGLGERVKIVDGIFVNLIGTIVEVSHEKGSLSVLVSIFGRDTRVDDLEFWQVELISEEVVSG